MHFSEKVRIFPLPIAPKLFSNKNLFSNKYFIFFYSTCLFYFIFILEKGERRGRERERETSMRERNITRLPSICALPEDRTSNPGRRPGQNRNSDFLVCGTIHNQLSHTHRLGLAFMFYNKNSIFL